ncbi:MAG: YfhO family protein, partial [Lachnospiraceae bacterium]|nr:YfhO family protein [Lachnospiraceae bacterium]
LDGAQTEIIRADNCYMAVRVSPGKHSVEFSYSTPHMGIWALISLISIAVLVFCLVKEMKKKRV